MEEEEEYSGIGVVAICQSRTRSRGRLPCHMSPKIYDTPSSFLPNSSRAWTIRSHIDTKENQHSLVLPLICCTLLSLSPLQLEQIKCTRYFAILAPCFLAVVLHINLLPTSCLVHFTTCLCNPGYQGGKFPIFVSCN